MSDILDSKPNPAACLPPDGTLQKITSTSAAASSSASFASSAAVASSASAFASSAPAAFSNFYTSSAFSTSMNVTFSESDDEDDGLMPWERESWVPTTKSGKQKSPNVIRNELQRYIDQCKADGASNQTRIMEQMGVNGNSFRKFMNPTTYKDPWTAAHYGTYWAAARLLARVAHEKELAKKAGKRKSTTTAVATATAAADGTSTAPATKKPKTLDDDASLPRKMTSAELKLEALQLIQRIIAVEGVPEDLVYDTCPQVVAKIKEFLQRDGMTKANLLMALGDINGNSMNKFLSGKKQDQCGNVTYRAAYVFFEKLRILEGKKKSAARRKNESDHPSGFSLVKERAGKYFYVVPGFRGW